MIPSFRSIGDSNTFQNHGKVGTTLFSDNRGYGNWLRALSWGAIGWDQWLDSSDPITGYIGYGSSNRGIPNNRTVEVATRFNRDMLVKPPLIGLLSIGEADVQSGVDPNTTLANLKSFATQMADKGTHAILSTSRIWTQPWTTAASEAAFKTVNHGLRSWYAGQSNQHIHLFDCAALVYGCPEGQPIKFANPAHFTDGRVHLSSGYAFREGQELANFLVSRGLIAPFSASTNMLGSILARNIMNLNQSHLLGNVVQGTGHVNGRRPTDVMASFAAGAAGNTTIINLQPNPLTGGQSIAVTVNPNAATPKDTLIFNWSVIKPVPTFSTPVIEVEFDDSPYWIGATAYLGQTGVGSNNAVMGHYWSDLKPTWPAAKRYPVIGTALPSNGDPEHLNLSLYVVGTTMKALAPAKMWVHQACVADVPNPKSVLG